MRWDIPVDPDADTAREWARAELGKQDYQSTGGTNWLERFMQWVQNLLDGIGGGIGGAWGGWGTLAAVIIGAGLIALVVWLVVGPLRRSRGRPVDDDELGDPNVSAAELLAAARSAADAGNWSTAVIEAYRALIRSLTERDVIDARPGMTAFEAALAASAALPQISRDVTTDADVFDAVRYGHLRATKDHYEHILATRSAASKAKVEVPA
jgi:hypothetical protein